jgi:hypothetical protein
MEKYIKYWCKFYGIDLVRKLLVVVCKRLEIYWPDKCLCEDSEQDYVVFHLS